MSTVIVVVPALVVRIIKLSVRLSVLSTMASCAVIEGAATELGDRETRGYHDILYETSEASSLSVDASPDGNTILLSVMGDIYTVSIDGGDAERIRGGRAWDQAPRYSPDGRYIAFASHHNDRPEDDGLWLMKADGTQSRKLMRGNVQSLAWDPEGGLIYSHVLGATRSDIHVYSFDAEAGNLLDLGISNAADSYVSPSGRYVYFSTLPLRGSRLYRFDRSTGSNIALSPGGSFSPRVSSDGRWLAFGQCKETGTELRIRELASGEERVLVSSRQLGGVVGGVTDCDSVATSFDFAQDNKSVVVGAAGAIRAFRINGGTSRTIPFRIRVHQEILKRSTSIVSISSSDLLIKQLRWVSVSPSSESVVFSAVGKIWVADLSGTVLTDRVSRLTGEEEHEYGPIFSPDGKDIAYFTWSDEDFGSLKIISAEGGTPRTIAKSRVPIASAAWSPTGDRVFFVSGGALRGSQEPISTSEEHKVHYAEIASGQGQKIGTLRNSPYGFVFGRYYSPLSVSNDGARVYFNNLEFSATSGKHELVSIESTGGGRLAHLEFADANITHAVPSPSGTHVALATRTGVWVLTVPRPGVDTREVSLLKDSSSLQRISRGGSSYLSWRDERTLTWSLADEIYSWQIGEPQASLLAQIELRLRKANPERPVAYTNTRIITMNGDVVHDPGTIVVEGDRIAVIGSSNTVEVPSDAVVLELPEHTIIPGLIDTHSHLHQKNRGIYPTMKYEYIASLAYGVTTVFDPAAPTIDVFAQAELVEAGQMIGPRVFSSGAPVFGPVVSSPNAHVSIESMEDARDVVLRQKKMGAIMVKSYMLENRDQRQWLAQAASEHGLGITAEGGHDISYNYSLVSDGYTAIEHYYPSTPRNLSGDVLKFLSLSGTHITPTLAVLDYSPPASLFFLTEENYVADPKRERFSQPDRVPAGLSKGQRIQDWRFLRTSRNMARLINSGGKVDIGHHGNLPGLGTHRELWMLSMGGLSPMEVLRSGTLRGAEKLGLDNELGSLEIGKLADFLVLSSDPLKSIRNTVDVRYVVKNGFIYEAESMTQMWPEYKPLPKPWWHSGEDWEALKPELPEPWEGVPIAEGVELDVPTVH